MSASKKRFKVVFTMAHVKEGEAGYPKLLLSERKGKANQSLGYDFFLNFVLNKALFFNRDI